MNSGMYIYRNILTPLEGIMHLIAQAGLMVDILLSARIKQALPYLS
jgi:hypothetical protein